MSDSTKKNVQPPKLKSQFGTSFTIGALFALLVMLLLPLSQLIERLTSRIHSGPEVTTIRPPETPMETPPPPEEDEQEDIEEMEQEREPPTLQELEIAMNTDLSGITGSDFTMPTFDIGGQIEEIIFELKDLDRRPRAITQRDPVYPPELNRANIEGEVTLEFVVNEDGTTSRIVATNSTNPAFEEPAIRAVRSWRFEPGEKDGKRVKTRVRIRIPFVRK